MIPERASSGRTLAFRHALLQEAVYDDLLPAERKALHAAYASALESYEVPNGAAAATHLSAIAAHASAAGERGSALRSWIRAARASSEAFAFAEAAQSYQRALDLWDRVRESERPDDVDHAQLLFEASVAFDLGNEPHRAVDLARQAVDAFDPTADPARAAMLLERLADSLMNSGDLITDRRVLEEAAALVRGHPPSTEGALVLAHLAYYTWGEGEYRRASELAREAIA